jgi:hypothetical protein
MQPETGPFHDWSSVVIIGEFTTSGGPGFDDHFLVLVVRSGQIIEYPTREDSAVIPHVEAATGARIRYGLSHVTVEASRIIHPPALADHPLFFFTRPKQTFKGLIQTIRRFGVTEVTHDLTDEVKDYLQGLRLDRT